MSERRTIPCYIIFENDMAVLAFFDMAQAEAEICLRKAEKHTNAENKLPDGTFYYIHIHEVPLVDRRKPRGPVGEVNYGH